jgi:hypothetical protein
VKRAVVAASLAAVVLAGIGVAACGGNEEPTSEPTVETASSSDVPVVPCATSLGGARYSGTELDDRLVLDVVYVGAGYKGDAATPSGAKNWPYFAETGLTVRADAPAVQITVPEEWRDRAAISWGNKKPVHSLRFPSCPSYGLPWNVFDGGFHLRGRTACVPLLFTSEGKQATVPFGIGTRCSPS